MAKRIARSAGKIEFESVCRTTHFFSRHVLRAAIFEGFEMTLYSGPFHHALSAVFAEELGTEAAS